MENKLNTNLDLSALQSKGETTNLNLSSLPKRGTDLSLDGIREVLPKSGLVYSERGGLAEILCKPKILPIKSSVLIQLSKQSEGK